MLLPILNAGWTEWIGSFGLINQFGNWCLNRYTVNWAPWLLPVIVQSVQIHRPATGLRQFLVGELEQKTGILLPSYFVILISHSLIFTDHCESKRYFLKICLPLHTSWKIAAALKKHLKKKKKGIIILWSALFLPIRVCEVFISVIVIHPSSVHSDLITAYEKWLMAVMSVSPLSANHVSGPLWNSNSPFIPLHCLFLHLIYPFTCTFSRNKTPFLNATGPDIS